MNRILPLLGALLLLPACQQTPVDTRTDRVTMPDGFELAATWRVPADADQAVVLFNECGPNVDQSMYAELAEALAREGFAVLTHDYRGTGGSRTEAFDLTNRAHLDAIRGEFGRDTRNLIGYTRLQYELVGAVGASCGAYRLVDLVEDMPDLKALVSVSGGATENGLEVLQVTRPVSVLGIVSRADASSLEPTRTLVRSVQNRAEFMMENGSAHGMELIAGNENVRDRIVEFIVERVRTTAADGARIGQMQEFSAFYSQGGMPMAVKVTNPSAGLVRAVIETQLPGSGRILADTIEHDAWGAFSRRSFEFMAVTPERVLAGTVGDSLVVMRQPRDGGDVTKSSQLLNTPVIDATWVHWMLGVMNKADQDSVTVPLWNMTPGGAQQRFTVFHRGALVPAGPGNPDGCTWWEMRSPAYTLKSCVTDAPPYLIRQEVETADGSVQPLLQVNSPERPSGLPSF